MINTTRKILRLSKDDVPKIVNVLCDSFFNYPVMRFVIDSETNYSEKLETLNKFFVMARIFRNEIILGIGAGSGIDGVALISNPDNTANPSELNELRERVWAEMGTDSRSRYQKFSDVSTQFHVDVPHIHLSMIEIRSHAQGMGLGRRLIEEVHRVSQDDPVSCGVTLTTEDPAKVSFYKYLGYHIIGQAEIVPGLITWSFFRTDSMSG